VLGPVPECARKTGDPETLVLYTWVSCVESANEDLSSLGGALYRYVCWIDCTQVELRGIANCVGTHSVLRIQCNGFYHPKLPSRTTTVKESTVQSSNRPCTHSTTCGFSCPCSVPITLPTLASIHVFAGTTVLSRLLPHRSVPFYGSRTICRSNLISPWGKDHTNV